VIVATCPSAFCAGCGTGEGELAISAQHDGELVCEACATAVAPQVPAGNTGNTGNTGNNLAAADGLKPVPEGAFSRVWEALRGFAFFQPVAGLPRRLWPCGAGCDERTVRRAKVWLRDAGYITWTRTRQFSRGRWAHSMYRILAGWHRPHRRAVLRWLQDGGRFFDVEKRGSAYLQRWLSRASRRSCPTNRTPERSERLRFSLIGRFAAFSRGEPGALGAPRLSRAGPGVRRHGDEVGLERFSSLGDGLFGPLWELEGGQRWRGAGTRARSASYARGAPRAGGVLPVSA
jgi:hypothetical protein